MQHYPGIRQGVIVLIFYFAAQVILTKGRCEKGKLKKYKDECFQSDISIMGTDHWYNASYAILFYKTVNFRDVSS